MLETWKFPFSLQAVGIRLFIYHLAARVCVHAYLLQTETKTQTHSSSA